MQGGEGYCRSAGMCTHTQPAWTGNTLHVKCWAHFMSDVYISEVWLLELLSQGQMGE